MLGLQELRAANERAAERELAQLRADTVRGLRWVFSGEGESGVVRLLVEAGIVPASALALRPVERKVA